VGARRVANLHPESQVALETNILLLTRFSIIRRKGRTLIRRQAEGLHTSSTWFSSSRL